MKYQSLLSDRALILLLIQSGMTCFIAGFFIPVFENKGFVIFIATLFPMLLVSPVFKQSSYKKLKFADDKYPARKEGNTNLLLVFLLPAVYIVFIFLYYYSVEYLAVKLEKDIYFFFITVFYFMTVFHIFVRKLAYEEERVR